MERLARNQPLTCLPASWYGQLRDERIEQRRFLAARVGRVTVDPRARRERLHTSRRACNEARDEPLASGGHGRTRYRSSRSSPAFLSLQTRPEPDPPPSTGSTTPQSRSSAPRGPPPPGRHESLFVVAYRTILVPNKRSLVCDSRRRKARGPGWSVTSTSTRPATRTEQNRWFFRAIQPLRCPRSESASGRFRFLVDCISPRRV